MSRFRMDARSRREAGVAMEGQHESKHDLSKQFRVLAVVDLTLLEG